MSAANGTNASAQSMSQILTVAATSAPWWSFSSELWNSLRALQWAAAISALILTVGAVIEYWHKLELLARLISKLLFGKSTAFDRCVLKKVLIHSLGPILVVLGIAGDFVFEGRAFIVEDRQEEQNRKMVGSLSDKATTASVKADAASDKSDVVSKQADAIQKRLDAASAQLGNVTQRVAAQGPRAKLLVKAAPDIMRAVSPFAGQRVRLFVCGQQGAVHQETLDTWAAIANILGSDLVAGIAGAKWNIINPNLGFAANCGAAGGLGQGQGVIISKRASKHTREAATALANALEGVLPPSPNKMLGLIDPDFAKLVVDRGFQPKDEPWNIVAFDEDLIAVTVGEHP